MFMCYLIKYKTLEGKMKDKIRLVLILIIVMSALNVRFAMGETSFTNDGDVKIIESSELKEYSEKLSEFMKNRKPIEEDKIYGNVKESSTNTKSSYYV